MPSHMIIKTESIVGYNNKLNRANSNMKLGVNLDENIEQKSVGIKHNLGTSKVQLPHTDNPKSSQSVRKSTLGSSQIILSSKSVLGGASQIFNPLQPSQSEKPLQPTQGAEGYKDLINCQFKFQWHSSKVKEVSIFISDAKSDAIYIFACQAVTQNLLRRSMIAYLFKRLFFYIKTS